MSLKEVMVELEALGTEKGRQQNAKNGANENQFGAKMGDIRSVANRLKANHELALELWATDNWDARLLSTLLMKPKLLSAEELDQLVRSVHYAPARAFSQLADWLMSYVVKQHPQKGELRLAWMASNEPMALRAGWSLTAERASKSPEGLDPSALLDRIEHEMRSAPAPVQWTMNFCLAEIGINFPELRDRALAIGEKLGIYRDYPTPKGCTSPFAPIWIRAMVERQG